MRTWKRIGELNNEDLIECSVWVFEYELDSKAAEESGIVNGEGDRDGFVAKRESSSPLTDNDELFIVRSKFVLADGSTHYGFSCPIDGDGLDYAQPVIISSQGHINLWNDNAPLEAEPQAACRKLGKKVAEIFPLICFALVEGEGEFKSWEISSIHVP